MNSKNWTKKIEYATLSGSNNSFRIVLTSWIKFSLQMKTATSALQSASSSAVATELKEFSQHLNMFPFNRNAQPVDPFITDPSVKTTV
jgi:hypothetical protein